MKNLDTMKQDQSALLKQVQDATAAGNTEQAAEAFATFAQGLQDQILAEARELVGEVDQRVLASRGVRTLTAEEQTFYKDFSEAAQSAVPQMALSNLQVALPKTVIDSVMEDVEKAHPLLSKIRFVDAAGMTEMLINTGSKQLAVWGKLCSEIKKELEGGFKSVQLVQNKLSAFIPVCSAMLEIGPAWLDKYVRAMLSEAIAYGLEEAVINGSGVDSPVGMTRDISKDFNASTGYPVKAAKAVTSFEPAAFGAVLAELAKDGKGGTRTVGQVVLIVNPVDYFTKVLPAVTLPTAMGYAPNVFPYPTEVIQSEQVETGKAIIGIAERYWMGVSIGDRGRIEYSDDFHFLQDERVYKAKLYGNGMPLDNAAFQLLDISKLKPLTFKVETVGAAAEGK